MTRLTSSGAEILPTDVTLNRDASNLYITLNGTTDKITVQNWFTDSAYRIEKVEFANGTVWDEAKLASTVYTVTTNSDTIYAGRGNDILEGGVGNDTFYGDSGNDIYLFNKGFGQDTIYDYDTTTGNIDTIRFGAGILPTDVTLYRDKANLYITLNGTTDKVTVQDWFTDSAYRVEKVEFANGTVWDEAKLASTGYIDTLLFVNETPTDLTLSNFNIAENQAIGTLIGNLNSTDPDVNNTFTYSLINGTGATDNSFFAIDADGLKTNAIFDYEAKNSYSIRVRTTDQGGLSFEKALTVNVTNVNEDDQASVILNATLAIPTFAKVSDDIFNISGSTTGKPKLQITLSDSNLIGVNELAVFTVDDAQGKINGIAPTESGYSQAALNRAKVVFSAIANAPQGFDPKTLSRLLEFNTGDNLRFLLVKNDTLDNVRKQNPTSSNVLFSNVSNQKITDSGTGSFSLAWEDGTGNSSDFKDLVVTIQPTEDSLPLGSNLQDQQQGEVLDLSSVDSTKTVNANFTVNREAAYNNFVGFYKVSDSQGTITDPLTGASINPSDSGYVEAAIKNCIAGIDLQAANQATATLSGVFQGGSIFAPFIIANGSISQFLDADKSNDPAVYFAYLGANSDGVDHIRLLANNVFGFEDLPKGGDFDYNDIIIKANLTVV